MSQPSLVQLEDFIPNYPDLSDEDFFLKLAQKKELQELTLGPIPVKDDLLYTSQKYMQRMFSPYTPYTVALLAHDPGAGKTCTAAAIIEGIKSGKITEVKRALVFVKNEALVGTFEDEIAYRCTEGLYSEQGGATKKAEKMRVRSAIGKYYQIVTQSFIKKIMKRPQKVPENYSGRVIIFDEAHTITEVPPSKAVRAKGEIYTDEATYKNFLEFTHLVEGIIIMMTGTPIWDKPAGFASLMNLILPTDDQLPVKTFNSTFYDKKTGEFKDPNGQLRAALRGRVSYLRNTSNIKKIERGIVAPLTKFVKVYPDVWSPFQEAMADRARTEEVKVKGKKSEKTVAGGTLSTLAVAASTMVYPKIKDGKIVKDQGIYDKESFEAMVMQSTKSKVKYRISSSILRDELTNNLAKYSAKFSAIIQDIVENPNHVTFVYCENVSGIGGVFSLGLCLELHGLEWNKTPKGILRPSTTKRRFTIITGTSESKDSLSENSQIVEFLKLHNRYEPNGPSPYDNRYGAHSQVIIASEKILGMTIKYTRKVHIVIPHWNVSSNKQAEARAIRLGALDALPKKEREVEVFLHVGVRSGNYVIEDPRGAKIAKDQNKGPGGLPIDLHIMSIAEEKVAKSSPIERMLKEESFDCVAYYKRNVLETDVDGSRECDYRECNYQCDGIPPPDSSDKSSKVWNYSKTIGQLDYSTYNLLYGVQKRKDIVDQIIHKLSLRNNYDLDELRKDIKVQKEYYSLFLQSVDDLINGRVMIANRLGIKYYVKAYANHIFLDAAISSSILYGPEQAEYTENVLVTSYKTLSEQVAIKELESDISLLGDFCVTPSPETINEFSSQAKIDLFEQAFIYSLKYPDLPIIDAFTDYFKEAYFEVEESTGIWIHILYKLEKYKKGEYSKGREKLLADGKTRIVNANEAKPEWSFMTDRTTEENYMRSISEGRKESKEKVLKESPFGFYGLMVADKKGHRVLKLRFITGPGRVATTYSVPFLVNLLLENIKYDVFEGENPIPSSITDEEARKNITNNIESIEEMPKAELELRISRINRDFVTKDKTLNDLRNAYFFLAMRNGRLVKGLLAAYIQSTLEENGLLEES